LSLFVIDYEKVVLYKKYTTSKKKVDYGRFRIIINFFICLSAYDRYICVWPDV